MKQTLLSNGRRIAFRTDGTADGLPLVLLHGFCEDATLWDGLVDLLKNIHIIRIELPGFGDSEPGISPEMDAYADAVFTVLDYLSIEKCVLIGHSMGGYAGLAFAAKHPVLLAGFGLVHSHPFEDTEERKEARRRGIEMLLSGKRDLYVAQLFPGLFAESFAKAHPQIIDDLIANGKRQSPEGIIAALEGMIRRKDHTETLRAIACPALFLLGLEDSIIPSEQGLQAAVLPEIADVHVLPGIGHMSMFEATEMCAEIVRCFWEFCAAR